MTGSIWNSCMNRKPTAYALLLVLMACVFSGSVGADCKLDFAESLMAEKDYFRAITEFKKIKFFCADESLRQFCDLKISEAYLWSNKYDLSISVLGSLASLGGLNEKRMQEVDILLGLNYLGMRVFPTAQGYFNKALDAGSSFFPLLYLALIDAEDGKWLESEKRLVLAMETPEAGPYRSAIEELRSTVRRGPSLESRSTFLAFTLSAAVPGAGQLYTGHPVDSIQALLSVGALSFATYGFYLYDSSRRDSYLLTGLGIFVTALFHGANIYGATRTAEYFNAKQKEDFLASVRESVFSIWLEIQ